MKEKKQKPEYVKICPNCDSLDISPEISTMQQTGALPSRYVCNNCGFTSFAFPEANLNDYKKSEEKVTKIPKEKKQEEKIDFSYGNFMVRVVWKYLSILIIIASITDLIFFENQPTWLLLLVILVLIIGVAMFYITFFWIKNKTKK